MNGPDVIAHAFLRCIESLSMRGPGSSVKQTFGFNPRGQRSRDQDEIVGSFRWYQLNGFANFALASDGDDNQSRPREPRFESDPPSGLDRLSYKNGPFVRSGRYSIS